MPRPLLRRPDKSISREKTLAAVTALLGAALTALVSFEIITQETATQVLTGASPIIAGIWMWLFRTREER